MVQNHREEYAICMQFASAMEKELGVPMSIDEAVLLTLFLCEDNETHKAEDGPVVLIAMHGDSTAAIPMPTICRWTRICSRRVMSLRP